VASAAEYSDRLLRRDRSLTAARKAPIVAGMLMSISMILCNYLDARSLVAAIMALSFFGKGVGALGWAVVSDTVPREIAGLSGGLFNMFGNLSSITTPIVIGLIIQSTGSFDGALVFIGANALVAIFSYLVDCRRNQAVRTSQADRGVSLSTDTTLALNNSEYSLDSHRLTEYLERVRRQRSPTCWRRHRLARYPDQRPLQDILRAALEPPVRPGGPSLIRPPFAHRADGLRAGGLAGPALYRHPQHLVGH
jgi:MFS family permease